MIDDAGERSNGGDEAGRPAVRRRPRRRAAVAAESPTRSFVDRLTATRAHLIHKLKAKDSSGRWAYYFVLVMPALEAQFLAAIESDGTVDLEDYGTVIASCFGEGPSEYVRDYLREKYGFEV